MERDYRTEYKEILKSLTPKKSIQQPETNVTKSGLTTKDALQKLNNELKIVVDKSEYEFNNKSLLYWLKVSLSYKSELSKMRWPSVLFMSAQTLVHFVVAFGLNVDNPAVDWVGLQGFVLLGMLFFNLSVNLWDTKLRFREMLTKSQRLLELIKACSENEALLTKWKQDEKNQPFDECNKLNLPSVHETITLRDNNCVSLPDFLLVKGDIIRLYYGDKAPADCILIENFKPKNNNSVISKRRQSRSHLSNSSQSNDDKDDELNNAIKLNEGDIYKKVSRVKTIFNKQSNKKTNHRFVNMQQNETSNRAMNHRLFEHARLRRANSGKYFELQSTPYVKCLQLSLKQSHARPVNSVEKECFVISRKFFETYVIPMLFVLSTIMTAIHYGYLDLIGSDQKIKTISIAYLLLRPSLTVMPFLPWMFPFLWLVVNAYGNARLLCCGEMQRLGIRKKLSTTIDMLNYSPDIEHLAGNYKQVNSLGTPAGNNSEQKGGFDSESATGCNLNNAQLFKTFIELIFGRSGQVWRSSNLLQVLGSLTSLCFINRAGILSWPAPSPEKVFVLTQKDNVEVHDTTQVKTPTEQSLSSSQAIIQTTLSLMEQTAGNISINNNNSNRNTIPENDENSLQTTSENQIQDKSKDKSIINLSKACDTGLLQVEILDLTQSTLVNHLYNPNFYQSLFGGQLQFDDLNWRKYLNNLKPLGLAILMNNCCHLSICDYFKFYKHIINESLLQCNSTPIIKRRCLCQLSRLIGFSSNAISNYLYENQIGIYKLIDQKSIETDNINKLTANLERSNRLKLPFPNMVCNLFKDKLTGTRQAFSSGTADMILDTCIEYWDGKQLQPLDEATRKKILDFYHRTSLTASCAAFSYTPVLRSYRFDKHYIEFPANNSKSRAEFRRLTKDLKINSNSNSLGRANKSFSAKRNNLTKKSSKLHMSSESLTKLSNNYCSNTEIDFKQQSNNTNINNEFNTIEENANQCSDKERKALRLNTTNTNKKSKHFDEQINSNETHQNNNKLKNVIDELSDQVFVGMVSMQYQAFQDCVRLIEQLEHACIRFVHFSRENELRSRIFSEKLGLESGWNCHISLRSDSSTESTPSKKSALNSKLSNDEENDENENYCCNVDLDRQSEQCNVEFDSDSIDAQSLSSWRSVPLLSYRKPTATATGNTRIRMSIADDETCAKLLQNVDNEDSDRDNVQHEQLADVETSRDEEFESIAFDMANRAKLPRGIENIRPHLETVDNVPLQVSLFTDCTPELTEEMIKIMQEYGEIVCVIGSSSSRYNTPMFLQANASIAIEPLNFVGCADVNLSEIYENFEKSTQLKEKNINQTSNIHNNQVVDDSDDGKEYKSNASNISNTNIISNQQASNNQLPSSYASSETSSSQSSLSTSSSSSTSSLDNENSSDTSSSESGFSSTSSNESNSLSSKSSEKESSELITEKSIACIGLREAKNSLEKNIPNPTALASLMASFPCSYSFSRKEPVDLHSFIIEARHFTFKMKNTFVCMICFALSISSAQFLTSIFFLPPLFTSGFTIWLTVFVVPILSFSLMGTTMDSQVTKIAVGKNLQLKRENIIFFVICYLIKFIPSILIVVFSFGLIIAHSCQFTGFGSLSLGPCWMFTYVRHHSIRNSSIQAFNTNSNQYLNQTVSGNINHNQNHAKLTGNNDDDDDDNNNEVLWSTHLLAAQVCASFLTIIYLIVISSGFVHRSHLLWQRNPLQNYFWVAASICLLIIQYIYSHLVLIIEDPTPDKKSIDFIINLPAYVWILSFSWPFIVLGINLLVKRAEIKATTRQQRRARFDFNTKLGMNSPF